MVPLSRLQSEGDEPPPSPTLPPAPEAKVPLQGFLALWPPGPFSAYPEAGPMHCGSSPFPSDLGPGWPAGGQRHPMSPDRTPRSTVRRPLAKGLGCGILDPVWLEGDTQGVDPVRMEVTLGNTATRQGHLLPRTSGSELTPEPRAAEWPRFKPQCGSLVTPVCAPPRKRTLQELGRNSTPPGPAARQPQQGDVV